MGNNLGRRRAPGKRFISFRRMRGRLASIAAVASIGIIGAAVVSEAQVEVQAFFGSAKSASLPITVSQRGQADLHFTARWATRPTRPTPYYAARVGVWRGNRGWRLDILHHKLYLLSRPPEIDDFRITNGFNILSLSRAFRLRHLTYSIGTGPVLTYPISTVRGAKYNENLGWKGYRLSGGSIVGAVTREFPLTAGVVFSLDARVSGSYVRVPVVNGHADVPNLAVHLHGGIGYLFGRRAR